MTVLAERVAAGALLLDQHRPGWEHVVRADKLAMEDCYACVLGQVYGRYHEGTRALGIDLIAEETFGFNTWMSKPDWEALANLWRGEVLARLVRERVPETVA